MQKDINIKAAIVDMDGVITQTAVLHAEAWKIMFDEFLSKKEKNYRPFDINSDYRKYIDGKPRLDGVRSFLESRGINIPEGSDADDENNETISGLGRRKNNIFHEILDKKGVIVYKDTAETLKEWKQKGLKLALITSSKNGRYIMEKTGLLNLFEVMVDGIRSEELKLKGKPEPDIFLQACEELNVKTNQAVIIEDAVAGVEAGSRGKFGLVVGVVRNGSENDLKKAGADIIVKDLTEIINLPYKDSGRNAEELPDALDKIEEIKNTAGNRKPAFFLDYDGTLTPIVPNPDDAVLTDSARKIISDLSERYITAVVSGRDRADVKSKVAIDSIVYAGSHGFDITGPGNLNMQSEAAKKLLPELDSAEQNLKNTLDGIKGAFVERKKYAIAVHYRNVADQDVQQVKNAVYAELEKQDKLKEGKGKKVLELKPGIDWHKGKAVEWLMKALGVNNNEHLVFYIGDDITDEDAFKEIKDYGIGIMVGTHGSPTHAKYRLKDTGEALSFLQQI